MGCERRKAHISSWRGTVNEGFAVIGRLRENATLIEMGRNKGAYNPEFPTGTVVRIADRPQLEEFMRSWRFHHPLSEDQLGHAGKEARVVGVAFYHGGDELYEVEGAPGIWHEACLTPL
jgi:hypothetical protein